MGPVSRLEPGTIFAGDFRVVRPLSEGGMGSVYVVEQTATGRERALKLMHPDLVADDKHRRRFEQEARVSARIESSHVVEVIAAGIDAASGVPWLVMELLKGEDLAATFRRRGRLSQPEVAELFSQLCHALSAAHRVGVVHRDLKPENIFLAEPRSPGVPFTVKVLDFGIAKVVAEGATHATAPIGTPMWMAPEQTGPSMSILPQTDIWPLGLIAFRALTGRSYWVGAGAEAASPIMLLREVVFEALVPATERAAALGCGETLPAGFDAWFARCVAREAEQRFGSVDEAYSGLADILGVPAEARMRITGSVPSGFRAVTHPPDAPLDSEESATVVRARAQNRRMLMGAVALGIGALIAAGIGLGIRSMRMAVEEATAAAMASAQEIQRQKEEKEAAQRKREDIRQKRVMFDRVTGEMVVLRAGAFEMGSMDADSTEQPTHKVTVPEFELDVKEVSVAAYDLCVRAAKCTPPATGSNCNSLTPERKSQPVNCVTWTQAKAFCDYAVKRLPTEEEWEYAARGAESRKYVWGASAPLREPCWNRYDKILKRGEGTCAVGSSGSDRSWAGIMDLTGNVQEWTATTFCPYSRQDCKADEKAVRGGSWRESEPDPMRASSRVRRAVTFQDEATGFRCARDPMQP